MTTASERGKNMLKYGAIDLALATMLTMDNNRRAEKELEKPPEERDKQTLAFVRIESILADALLLNGLSKAATAGEESLVSWTGSKLSQALDYVQGQRSATIR